MSPYEKLGTLSLAVLGISGGGDNAEQHDRHLLRQHWPAGLQQEHDGVGVISVKKICVSLGQG